MIKTSNPQADDVDDDEEADGQVREVLHLEVGPQQTNLIL
jgi:hypothetical protein